MKKTIKAAAFLLAVCVLLSGCAKDDAHTHNGVIVTTSLEGKPALVGDIPCAFPLSTQPQTLNILASGYEDIDHKDVYVWKKYQEMTGVDVNWTTVKRSERAEAVAAALMNRQSIDLILRCKISSSRLTQYGESGLILDLAKDGLLEKNAPNCWAYLQAHPETLASITNPDGAIYALPQVNAGAELRVSRKIFINKAWLENVHMEVPKTTEEFYQLLKAFKEQDANGNGDPNDEVPFSSQDWASIQEAFFGAYGLGNRGAHNLIVDLDEQTGRVRLIAASDAYKAYLAYFRRLYAEGLLDNYIFTMTTEQWYNYAQKDLLGAFVNTNLATLPADRMDDWVAVEEALEGPEGDKLWSAIRANFHSTGAAVIPAACKDPALALRWLDYFWTDEGTLFYHMGVEGETFTSNADGAYDYMPYIYEEMKTGNQSFDDVVARYSPYPGGGNPTVEIAPYFMGGEMAPVPAQAARALFAYGPAEYWPSFTFTAAENETLGTIQTDIEKYCTAMRIEFITGTRPLSDWDAYKAQLDGLKASELLSIYQAAVDRYYALNAAH
ncbi:MAG: extracellular solute-binding protein [Clostridia bacterium]|nr:extracellular solute-binding protein [Clostridia bacterium]